MAILLYCLLLALSNGGSSKFILNEHCKVKKTNVIFYPTSMEAVCGIIFLLFITLSDPNFKKLCIVSINVSFTPNANPLYPSYMHLFALLMLSNPLLHQKKQFPQHHDILYKFYQCNHSHVSRLMCVSDIMTEWGGLLIYEKILIFPNLYEPCSFSKKACTTYLHTISGDESRKF